MNRFAQRRIHHVVLALSGVLALPLTLWAQATNITTSGLNTTIRPSGTTTFIDGGTRPGTGTNRPNLFHSFGNFSVGSGETALFRNLDASGATGSGYNGTTSNIFGRVTGGNVSNLFGTIDTATNFSQANLYLINPAGVLFGPTATLNVRGSVNITTADYLRLTDGKTFNALPGPADALLSIASVASFGFLNGNPKGTITIQGSTLALPFTPPENPLERPAGKNLSIVGGNISIVGGTLTTPDGLISLASVASSGEVIPITIPKPTFPEEFDLSGADFITSSFSQLGQIRLSQTLLGANISFTSEPGGVLITADQLTMDASSIRALTAIGSGTPRININVNSLTANGSNFSVLACPTCGAGTIKMQGTGSQGYSGILPIAETITLNQSSLAVGSESIFRGSINLIGKTINLTNSTLSTDPGGGGDPLFSAVPINLLGQNIIMNGGTLSTSTDSSNSAGEIFIGANNIVLSNGATLLSISRGTGTACPLGCGNAGEININQGLPSITPQPNNIASPRLPESISLNGSSITTDANDASAGRIQMAASTDMTLIDSAISSRAATGNAGPINVSAGNNLTVRNAVVSTESETASGGNIKLTAANLVRIVDSTITSSVKGQAGSNGGNIDIDPQVVVIQNSTIDASANAGAGGNINIAALGAVLVDPNSVLDASAATGVSGSVNISSPVQVLSGALVPMKLAYTQTGLSSDRCVADPKGQFSSFVQTGRDGAPQSPGGFSSSPLGFLDKFPTSSLDTNGTISQTVRLGLSEMLGVSTNGVRFFSGCRS